MSERQRLRVVVDIDFDIVTELDRRARQEELTRADIVRRAVRQLLFSVPRDPANGNIPSTEPEAAAAA